MASDWSNASNQAFSLVEKTLCHSLFHVEHAVIDKLLKMFLVLWDLSDEVRDGHWIDYKACARSYTKEAKYSEMFE